MKKVLESSTKTSLFIDTNGTLKLSFMIPVDTRNVFVEYLVLPAVGNDEAGESNSSEV